MDTTGSCYCLLFLVCSSRQPDLTISLSLSSFLNGAVQCAKDLSSRLSRITLQPPWVVVSKSPLVLGLSLLYGFITLASPIRVNWCYVGGFPIPISVYGLWPLLPFWYGGSKPQNYHVNVYK